MAGAMRGSREMVLTGVLTDCCLLSTAMAAADSGEHVRVVADACAGVSDRDHQRAVDVMALFGPLAGFVDDLRRLGIADGVTLLPRRFADRPEDSIELLQAHTA
jgi:isochorismate hydrolase